MREAGGMDVNSLFDDDYKDNEAPPVEVKLKTQPRRKREDASPKSEVRSPEVAPNEVQPASAAANQVEPTLPGAPVSEAARDDFAAPRRAPIDDGVDPKLALFIDNRIACRLDELFEEKIKPFVERALKEAKQNGNGHSP